MMKECPDAFSMTGDPFHQLHVGWIIDFMARNRLPAIYQLSENVHAGGLGPTARASLTCSAVRRRM
jgi:hypothetical protein